MQTNAKARVLVVDDHPLVCKAVSLLINRQNDMTCCSMVPNAPATIPAVLEHKPDLVLLDLKLKEDDGIKLLESLLLQVPHQRVLVFSQYHQTSFIDGSFKAGACGYVTKLENAGEILNAIRTVLSGKIYHKPRVSPPLTNDLEIAEPPVIDGRPRITARENQVLQLVGTGMKTRNIAAQLNLSVKTIETYREHLKRKLGLKNSAELNHFAICWMERRSPQ